MSKKILQINSSAKYSGSVTRDLTAQIVAKLQEKETYEVIERDVAQGLPFVNETILGGFFTPLDQQSDEQ